MNLEEVKATVSAANELEAVTWATPLRKLTRKIVARLSDGHLGINKNTVIDIMKRPIAHVAE